LLHEPVSLQIRDVGRANLNAPSTTGGRQSSLASPLRIRHRGQLTSTSVSTDRLLGVGASRGN